MLNLSDLRCTENATGWVDVKTKQGLIYLGTYRRWITDNTVEVHDRRERRFFVKTMRQAKLELIERYADA